SLFRGQRFRLRHLLSDILPPDRHTQVRVCLDPAVLILERLITFIERAHESEQRVVLFLTAHHSDGHVVFLAANRFLVEPRVRDLEYQRVLLTLRAGAHHFDDGVVGVLVDLIDQSAVWADAGLAFLRCRHWLEDAGTAAPAEHQLPDWILP